VAKRGEEIMNSLTIPQHSDPAARAVLIAVVVGLIWLAFVPGAQLAQPQTADAAQPIILVATPTPALPALAPIGAAAPDVPTAEQLVEPPAPPVAEEPASVPVAQAAEVQAPPTAAPCFTADRDVLIRVPLPVQHFHAESCESQADADAQLDAQANAAISAAVPLPMQVPPGAPTAVISMEVPPKPLVLMPPVGRQILNGQEVIIVAATPTP
jgi:hypothetical protein